jgi:hypothetical protein
MTSTPDQRRDGGGKFASGPHDEAVLSEPLAGSPRLVSDAYRCGACEARFTSPAGALYECSRCGGTQVEENRCEDCHTFMAKQADETCPECEDGDIAQAEAWEVDGALFGSAEEASEWVDGAEDRAEADAAALIDREVMVSKFDRARAERAAVLRPRMIELRRLIGDRAPKLAGTLDSMEEVYEVEPDAPPFELPVSFTELAQMLDVGSPAELAALRDRSIDEDLRLASAEAMRSQMNAKLPPGRMSDQVDEWFSAGASVILRPEDCLDALIPALGG